MNTSALEICAVLCARMSIDPGLSLHYSKEYLFSKEN